MAGKRKALTVQEQRQPTLEESTREYYCECVPESMSGPEIWQEPYYPWFEEAVWNGR